MQQSGTLKKRKKRTINKVNGLGVIPYDESQDFDLNQDINQLQRPFSSSNGKHLSFWFTDKNLLENRRRSRESAHSRGRVTRDASFHDDGSVEPEEDLDATSGDPERTLQARTNLPEHLQGRSHYLDKCTMQRLKLILLLGATTGVFPWKWNATEYRIDKWGSSMEKVWKVRWFLFTAQTFCLTIFQMYSFYCNTEDPSKTNRQLFQNSLSVLWYSWNLLYNMNMYFYSEKIREYINTMLHFNHKNVLRFVIHLDGNKDGGWYVIRVALLTSISQVFETVSIFIMLPFAPWFLFSYIYPKPWYWLIPGAFQEYCITGQVITSYILIGWLLVTHTNTVQFWLREMHKGNDTDFTTDELRTPQVSVAIYKSLQILCQCFNNCMSPMAIPMIKFQMFAAIVVCGYVLIRSMNYLFVEEFPAIISYPIGVLDTASMSFILLNMCAGVFDLGCSFTDSWCQTKNKEFRRILMGCSSLKVWVGRFYFLTVSSTLTFFQITFGYITDAIITFP